MVMVANQERTDVRVPCVHVQNCTDINQGAQLLLDFRGVDTRVGNVPCASGDLAETSPRTEGTNGAEQNRSVFPFAGG